MKISPWVAACGLGLLVCVAAYVWLARVAQLWIDPFALFASMGPLNQMAIVVVVMALIAGLVLAAIGRASKPGGGIRGVMSLTAAVAATMGALGAVYGWSIIQMTVRNMGGSVRLEIAAPAYLEVVASLGIGLASALVILLLRPRP